MITADYGFCEDVPESLLSEGQSMPKLRLLCLELQDFEAEEEEGEDIDLYRIGDFKQ